jgi:hypothetical protein
MDDEDGRHLAEILRVLGEADARAALTNAGAFACGPLLVVLSAGMTATLTRTTSAVASGIC